MKKLLLSTAIVSSFLSTPLLAATVYDQNDTQLKVGGRAEARANISDNNETAAESSFEDKSRARINLKGKTKINDSLGAFGTYEVEIGSGKGNTVNTRYLFAGLSTNIGNFSYGQQDSAQVMLTDYTDILATFGGDAADLTTGNKDKRENNFLYSGEFDALTIQANYIANNEKKNDSFGISGMYALPMGLDFGLGYTSGEQSPNGITKVDADQVNLAVRYTLNAFMVSGLFTTGEVDKLDATGYELAAAYKFDQWVFQGVYNFQEIDSNDTVNNAAIEAIYKLNKSFRTYAGYKFEQMDNLDDQLQFGLRYDF
ncbi:porin [Aliivibrio finisterrensis]|uniref:Porin n=1 Tax=Aliivibrio finisterrensis TaxID=511998 RepID=A0A4Q5KIE4_9GAMM|nr:MULTISPECIES: porin [Aliivibrio]MDD9175824.1 porin [Aliivibrio sp. S3TY1]MDD9192922.1 porin [Aliivibrio sp. S2TY2]RYU45949.1 porin [Aliivibrio finisterrensis]